MGVQDDVRSTAVTNPRSTTRRPTLAAAPLQEGFRELVLAAREACIGRFGPRLMASYVAGSVARGEAWPGASDLDWFAFLVEAPTAADRAWRRRMQASLQRRFLVADEVHLNVYPAAKLAAEPFWRFILRYNALRVCGPDLLGRLERRGIAVPKPDAALAKGRLPFVRSCLAEALAGRRIPALADLPADPALATRKLVRNFVIVEGAHYLMAAGAFETFAADGVLRGLRRAAPQWADLCDSAERILADPYEAAVSPGRFLKQVRPFVEWQIAEIESA